MGRAKAERRRQRSGGLVGWRVRAGRRDIASGGRAYKRRSVEATKLVKAFNGVAQTNLVETSRAHLDPFNRVLLRNCAIMLIFLLFIFFFFEGAGRISSAGRIFPCHFERHDFFHVEVFFAVSSDPRIEWLDVATG